MLRVRAHPTHRQACRRRDERGSLIVVLAVLFIIGLLSAAVVSRVVGDSANNNYESNLQRARALAQSGISDALFQIDQRDGSPGSFCNSPNPTTPPNKCSLTSIPGAQGKNYAEYTAAWNPANTTYTVLSRGVFHGTTYAVKAIIGPNPVINSALTGASIVFDGKTKFQNLQVTGANGLPVAGATATVSVATGGNLNCNGGGSPNAVYLEYQGSSTTCTPVQTVNTTYDPQPPSQTCPAPANTQAAAPAIPCMPGDAQSCNKMLSPGQGTVTGDQINGWTVSSTTSGGVTTPALIEPGVYVCYGGLTMAGTINVDYSQANPPNGGRVQIYVFGPQNNALSASNLTLDNGSGTTVNACEVGSPNSNPAANCVSGSQQIVGDPVDLQVYLYSGNVNIGSGLNSINAILWAPTAQLTTNGNSNPLTLTGAMVIGSLKSNGTNVTFNLNYDERIATEFQVTAWTFQSYLQTSNNFTIPNF